MYEKLFRFSVFYCPYYNGWKNKLFRSTIVSTTYFSYKLSSIISGWQFKEGGQSRLGYLFPILTPSLSFVVDGYSVIVIFNRVSYSRWSCPTLDVHLNLYRGKEFDVRGWAIRMVSNTNRDLLLAHYTVEQRIILRNRLSCQQRVAASARN